MFTRNLFSFICVLSVCLSFSHFKFSILKKSKLYSSNSDIFSTSPKTNENDAIEKIENSSSIISTKDEKQQKMIDEAAKLRREAAEMEGIITFLMK